MSGWGRGDVYSDVGSGAEVECATRSLHNECETSSTVPEFNVISIKRYARR